MSSMSAQPLECRKNDAQAARQALPAQLRHPLEVVDRVQLADFVDAATYEDAARPVDDVGAGDGDGSAEEVAVRSFVAQLAQRFIGGDGGDSGGGAGERHVGRGRPSG
jgi:hypothetical protein